MTGPPNIPSDAPKANTDRRVVERRRSFWLEIGTAGNDRPMPLVILCDGGHARLPDPWEVGPMGTASGPCVACGAATRLHHEPPEYEPGLGPFPPGYDIVARPEGATMGEVYEARHLPT